MRNVAWRDSRKQDQGRERTEENEQEDPGEVIGGEALTSYAEKSPELYRLYVINNKILQYKIRGSSHKRMLYNDPQNNKFLADKIATGSLWT